MTSCGACSKICGCFSLHRLGTLLAREAPGQGDSVSRMTLSCKSVVLFSLGILISSGLMSLAEQGRPDWRMGGQNLSNTRHQAAEELLGPENVAALSLQWVFTTGSNVSATPAVAGGA